MLDQIKNLKGLMGMLGQAGEMKAKFDQMQAELARKTVEADAGAGAVRVVANGKLEVVRVELDPVMVRTLAADDTGSEVDRQMIEDLIAAATNAALAKARDLVQEEMAQLAGGLNIPGLDGMLGR